jgi:hypothetical protein
MKPDKKNKKFYQQTTACVNEYVNAEREGRGASPEKAKCTPKNHQR